MVNYIKFVKNTRGILLYDPKKGYDERIISWLINKHRHRNIGIPPALFCERLATKPFVELFFPTAEVESLTKQLNENLTGYVAQALVLSLIFSTPLYILDQDIFKSVDEVTVWRLKVANLPSHEELLRHIRIANYAVIDFLDSLVEQTNEVIAQFLKDEVPLSRLKVILGKREDHARHDGNRRFWRIPSLSEGLTVIAYFDILRLFIQRKDLFKFFENSQIIHLLSGISCGLLLY